MRKRSTYLAPFTFSAHDLVSSHVLSEAALFGNIQIRKRFDAYFWQVLGVVIESRIFEVVLGAILAVGFAIFVEHLRKPKLKFSIAPTDDFPRPTSNGVVQVRSLKVTVAHVPLLRGLRWLLRGPAAQCLGTITFHHLDGQNVLGREMRARWANTAEPLLPTLNQQDQVVAVLDIHRAAADSRVDIFPAESSAALDRLIAA